MPSYTNGNTDGFPSLYSFKEAAEYHDSVTPYVRGEFKGKRPLGSVRKYNRSLIRREPYQVDGVQMDSVVMSYYGNDVIRRTEDGSVFVSTCGWPSISTNQMLNYILTEHGSPSKFVRSRKQIYLKTPNGHYCVPAQGCMRIKPDGTITGAASMKGFSLNKSKMRDKRNMYKPFMELCDGWFKLYNNLYKVTRPIDASNAERLLHDVNRLTWRRGADADTQKQLRDEYLAEAEAISGTDQESIETAMQLFERLILSASWSGYTSYRGVVGKTEFDKFFSDLIKLKYANEIFEETVICSPTAKLPSALFTNGKYVRASNT